MIRFRSFQIVLGIFSILTCTTACSVAKSSVIIAPTPIAQPTPITPLPMITLYEVLKDQDSSKMLRGIISKAQITQDTAFGWYAANAKLTKPNANAVAAIAAKADRLSFIIFGGTWCEDTHQLLPKYLSVLEAANFPNDRITLIAVDRAKTTVANLHKIFNVTNVPTCIVLKDGKEVGRIVEFGKTALVDKELGEMVAGIE